MASIVTSLGVYCVISADEVSSTGEFCAARPALCRGCKVEESCLGGCKAAAEACFGDVRAADPFLAAFAGQAHVPR